MRATGRAPVSNLILTVLHFFGHALLVGLVHWVLEHQTGEVCLQPLIPRDQLLTEGESSNKGSIVGVEP